MNRKQIASYIEQCINTRLRINKTCVGKCTYSCDALLSWGSCFTDNTRVRIVSALRDLGLDPEGLNEFDKVPEKRRQYARALWLTWVALMFEEGVV